MTGSDVAEQKCRPICSLLALLATALLLLLLPSHAQAVPGRLDPAHQDLARILRDFVRHVFYTDRTMSYRRTQVKYGPLLNSDYWTAYRRDLIRLDRSKIKSAAEADSKAFWINTYNALVIDGVLAEFPLAGAEGLPGPTVKSVPNFLTRRHPVAGEEVSLAEIERRLNRFEDPRVCLALCRGCVGSPPLPDEPYSAANIEEQLENACRNYLADPVQFHIDRERNQIVISEMFRDLATQIEFSGVTGPADLQTYPSAQRAVVSFIYPYIRELDQQYILEKKPSITYTPIDWSLNLAQ